MADIDDWLADGDGRRLLARLQHEVARGTETTGDATGTVVDELLAERRAEAAAESAE